MDTDTLFQFAVKGMKAQAEVNKLCQQPLAHTNDSLTSFEAADKMVKSGELSKKQAVVLKVMRTYSNNHADFTPRDLAGGNWSSLYFEIQRRKNELKNKGLIEKIGKTRDGCEVWRLK